MNGSVVTFYSYKGGVGRSFALASVAAVLARWGYRVLCVDWDLDAPGLTYYLRPWLAAPPAAGLVDLIADHAAGREPDPAEHVMPVALPGIRGRVSFLPAGAEDDAYVVRAQTLDWAGLYERSDLGGFIERCRERWTRDHDVVLVDSRTGITDIGGICTAQLPDVLVMLFTANEQSVRGTLDVARRAWQAHDALPYDRGGLRIVPVPSRFEGREEYEQAESWRARLATDLAPLVAPWASRELPVEKLLAQVTVPYVAYWSFGEQLPVLVETEPAPDSVSHPLETLAGLLAHGLGRTGLLAESRDSFVASAARAGRRDSPTYDVFLSGAPRQRRMLAALARLLQKRALRVFLPSEDVMEGVSWSPIVEEAIARSAVLVVVVDGDLSPWQSRETERFLRLALDEGRDGRVIPLLVPGTRAVPDLIATHQVMYLRNDGDKALAMAVNQIVRAVSKDRSTGAVGEAVQSYTVETLMELSGWELGPVRWQLVAEEVGAIERAVDGGDDDGLRAATADLEILGPSRAATSRARDVLPIPDELLARVEALLARLGGELDLAASRQAVAAHLDADRAGDHDAVLAPRALADARRYRSLAQPSDPDVAHLLGLLHLQRARRLADRGADAVADRSAALRYFADVLMDSPDAVPESMRDAVVAGAAEVDAAVRTRWAGRVDTLVVEGRTAPDRTPLDDAVWVAELVVDRTPADSPERAGHLAALSLAYRTRFRRWGEPADADRAVQVGRQAVGAGLPGPERSRAATALGLALVDRYEARGLLIDLDQAVGHLETAMTTAGSRDVHRAARSSNLASALTTRFLVTGDGTDLDRAVALLRRSVEDASTDAERAAYHANLDATLTTRYRYTRDGRDLDEAIGSGRAASAHLRSGDPDRTIALAGLGQALRTRFQRTGRPRDLDEAVTVLEEALDGASSTAARIAVASSLAATLRVRFEASGDPGDIARAVDLAESAVQSATTSAPRRGRLLATLGGVYATRYRSGGDPHDLDQAVAACSRALEILSTSDPLRAVVHTTLGLALRARSLADGPPSDLHRAVGHLRDAAQVVTAAPLVRALAAREWADVANLAGDRVEALRGFRSVLDLLGAVTDPRLPQQDQQISLRRLGGVASAAAATALAAGDERLALALLEQGRGVLLTHALETRGVDVALAAEHPDLAARFTMMSRRLNDPDVPSRARVVRAWEDVVDEIRTQPGWDRFLRAPDVDRLVSTVGAGTLVALNVAAERCDALLVTNGLVEVVPLPGLTYEDVHRRASEFLAAVHGDGDADGNRDAAVRSTLDWLRDVVVDPVLEVLEASVGTPRHLWWMPTGPLEVLPVAAAAWSSGDGPASSMTSTIRALAHASRPTRLGPVSTLVVAVQASRARSDLPPLPAAEGEAADVAATMDGATLLTGDEATVEAVRSALPAHDGAHFACHAVVDPADPSSSGLILADGSLTVRALQDLDVPDARLAYLSACSTAFGGGVLLDEAVHPATAFQQAGYRHVVATMWPIGDLAARRLARLTYAELAEGAAPATAVHRAVTRTRELLPDRPSVWAAHVHTGP